MWDRVIAAIHAPWQAPPDSATLHPGYLLDVDSFPIRRHWFVVHRKGKRLPAVALAFKEFLLQEAAQVMQTVKA
ncbi:MAG: hypothetical protein ACYCTW_12010 [Sulfuricella sp.]